MFMLDNDTINHRLSDHFQQPLSSLCPTCNKTEVRHTNFECHLPILAFEWGSQQPAIQNTITIVCKTTCVTYSLKGIIYYADNHFTAHFKSADGTTWYHDGISTQHSLILQPLHISQMTTAVVAIYCQNSQLATVPHPHFHPHQRTQTCHVQQWPFSTSVL